MAFREIKLGLRPFQALEIFLILQIEVDIGSKDIFEDKMKYEKIKYLIFWELITNIIRCFNIQGNTFAINSCY